MSHSSCCQSFFVQDVTHYSLFTTNEAARSSSKERLSCGYSSAEGDPVFTSLPAMSTSMHFHLNSPVQKLFTTSSGKVHADSQKNWPKTFLYQSAHNKQRGNAVATFFCPLSTFTVLTGSINYYNINIRLKPLLLCFLALNNKMLLWKLM